MGTTGRPQAESFPRELRLSERLIAEQNHLPAQITACWSSSAGTKPKTEASVDDEIEGGCRLRDEFSHPCGDVRDFS